MNRFLLSLMVGGIFASTTAQEKSTTDWYNYGHELKYSMGQDIGHYFTHVFPDSTVQVEYSNGFGSVWMHSLGQVFDPTSFVWSVDLDQVGNNDPYLLESISIPYRYYRPQNNAPDTLIIQVIKESDFADLHEDPWAGDPNLGGRSFAEISYDSSLLRSNTIAMEFVELLDYSDTASTQKTIEIEVNEQILNGEAVAVTVTYIPGNPYNTGDTLDAATNSIGGVSNQINAFLMNFYIDNDKNYETGIYNHGIIAINDSRYESGAWFNRYWPGVATTGGYYHADIDFLITTYTGVEEKQNIANMKVFPNPMINEGIIEVDVQDAFETGEVEITDVQGKVIKTIPLTSQLVGVQHLSINTSDISDGVYIVNLNIDGNTISEKLLIQ